jgi:hypothetical protein
MFHGLCIMGSTGFPRPLENLEYPGGKRFFLENPEMSWDFGQLILNSLNILEFKKYTGR